VCGELLCFHGDSVKLRDVIGLGAKLRDVMSQGAKLRDVKKVRVPSPKTQ
jgi:hypothetical protein